jgi:uncharacterized protein
MPTVRVATLLTLAVSSLALAQRQAPSADQVAEVKAKYVKREVRIAMRDGAQLFTSIYIPRDTSRAYPIMMSRTPYGVAPYGDTAYKAALGPSKRFQDEGFIFVYQDTRGRYMSDGTYAFMTPHIEKKTGAKDVDESSDTYDTIEWLLKNVTPNNGRVGTWGISAPGFFVAAGMVDAHPALKAASPQAPLIDWYFGDDRHHNGALTLAQTFNFLSNFDRPRPGPVTSYGPSPRPTTPDGYKYFMDMGPVEQGSQKVLKNQAVFWNAIMDHPNYDEFWQKRSLQLHLKDIKPAVLFVGGWYDAEDPLGPLEGNRAMDKLSPTSKKTLVMGPWAHGDWSRGDNASFGPMKWGQLTGPFYRDSIEFPFFMCHLRDQCGPELAKAIVFETGANKWHRYESWPPREATSRTIYLNTGNRLTWEPPTEATSFASYVSDPKKAVPYTTATSFGYYRQYPIDDQRFAATRPDVVVFQTDVLTEPLTIAGPIKINLKASTSGTDADYIVKVIDVFPDDVPDSASAVPGVKLAGYQQLVKGDVMRARWRKGYQKPIPMVPNEPATIEFALQDVYHTLKPGHRLMVQVQSTWFPLIDRNPQTFVPNIYKARESDFKTATMRIHHSKSQPSSLTFGVMPSVVP